MYNLYKKIKSLIVKLNYKLHIRKLKKLNKRFRKYEHRCTHCNCSYNMNCVFTLNNLTDYLDGKRPICLGGENVTLDELKAIKHNKNRK